MPNLATTRAIVWRRLAALRRRLTPERRAPLPLEPPPGPAAPAAGRIPAPLLVDYFGRDGSTALLRLLSTSAAVHVEGRYPYRGREPAAALAAPDPVAAGAATARPLRRGGAGVALVRGEGDRCSARRPHAVPRHARVIALLRDPRDIWVSIEAFSRAVGAAEIGGSGSRAERLDRFVERQRERLGWIDALASEDARVVRYDDLVTDPGRSRPSCPAGSASTSTPAGLAGDSGSAGSMRTSRDPARSVGRWRNGARAKPTSPRSAPASRCRWRRSASRAGAAPSER